MKVCGQNIGVTLCIHGREMDFSEKRLIAILEEHFANEAIEPTTTEAVVQGPIENQWFEVNPLEIDQSLFQKGRMEDCQDQVRQLILKAFNEVKNNPERYGKKFKTLMPEKDWIDKTVIQLKELACELGDHNADWVEQALEWAQRISNGESWKTLCEKEDTANWYRLIVWKEGYSLVIGGSDYFSDKHSPTTLYEDDTIEDEVELDDTVPLVVSYEM